MTKELAEWPSKRGAITKIMPSDGCKGDTAPWRWDCGMIYTNLDCIWEMSASTFTLVFHSFNVSASSLNDPFSSHRGNPTSRKHDDRAFQMDLFWHI